MHAIGVRQAARMQDAIVALKFALIIGFVIYAISTLTEGSSNLPAVQARIDLPQASPFAFANQLVWISLSFAGFNAAVYVSGEIQDARRNVPRAIIGGTVAVTLIYIVLNAIFVFATPPETIVGKTQVAMLAADSIGGPVFATFVSGVIVVSLFTSVSALIMTGPRVYAKMADDRLFPAWFRFSDRPPVQAIWFQAGLAITVIIASSLEDLIGYLGLTLSVCSALTVAMVFVLRWRGDIDRLPMWGIPPLVYVLATLFVSVLSAVEDPKQAVAAAITLALGFILFPLVRRHYA